MPKGFFFLEKDIERLKKKYGYKLVIDKKAATLNWHYISISSMLETILSSI